MDTLVPRFVGRFELLRAHAPQMAVAACAIVERHDVVGHVGQDESSVLVDLVLDPFLKLPKKDSATAFSRQFPFRLMLG